MPEFSSAEFVYQEPIKEVKLDVQAETLPKKGKTKEQNEDNHFFNSQNNSFAVLDGFGGEANGCEASRFCSDALNRELGFISPNTSLAIISEKFKQITQKVNQGFRQIQEGSGGATAVFGIICHDESGNKKAVIANLGDSRAYLFNPNSNELKCLTTDDNTVNYYEKNPLVAAEIQKHLDEASASSHLDSIEKLYYNDRNQVSNGFGNPNCTPHIFSVDIKTNDILVLTSDGIHDNLTTSEISKIISSSRNSSEISRNLINQSSLRSQDLNHFRHKSDDMTAMAIKIENI